jgi:hydrogenase expression/formation protein HypC
VKKACLAQLPEASVGDYVLVHVGFALSLVDPAEAERTYQLLEAMGLLDELKAPESPA